MRFHTTLACFSILILSMATPTLLAECPRLCECKWKSGKESVVCSNANFSTVPPDLDSGTQVLDLTDNNITALKRQEFLKAGLVNLQKIFLVRCRLKNLERDSFSDLINLVELDLSFNLLISVPSHVFGSIPELRELKLSGNPIQGVAQRAFAAVPQLIRLEMSGCKVTNVESRGFLGLEESLKWLKLDDNKLSEVDAAAFTSLRNLHGLELAGNPWNCSCKLRDLREWMLRQNVPFDIPPLCQSPRRLQGKSWKVLDLDEFACPPKIFASEVKAQGVEGKNVTISCGISAGIPTPNVKWMLRNRVIANLSGGQLSKKLYLISQRGNSSELTINSADVQDGGVYMCAAENKAGKAEAAVTLTVAKNSSVDKLSTGALLVSVLLGVTLTFLGCLLTMCLVKVRKRRLLKCHREDNYEKIEMNPKMCHKNLNGGVSAEDACLVSKRNGDYSVVPDTDHENEEEEEVGATTTPGTSASKAPKVDVRDNITGQTCNSTSGTFRAKDLEGVTFTSRLSTIYSTTTVPDVIGYSSSLSTSACSRTQSENGSASDINELFCTLPRKRDLGRYRSNDSQTALLTDSRYGSGSSSDSFSRRLSIEMQRLGARGGRNLKQPPSGSLLNLAEKGGNLNSTPLLDVKGLESRLSPHQLQLKAAASGGGGGGGGGVVLGSGVGNPYDYHAAQLEKFLEEYRVLQKQLTKMKQTCDSICQEQSGKEVAPPCTATSVTSSSSGSNLNNQVNSPNSNSIQDSVDFKNFENELTKYLMSRSPSTAKNFPSAALHN